MTASPHILANQKTSSLAGHVVEVRWRAVIAPGSAEARCNGKGGTGRYADFVINLEIVDSRHAILEAWIERPSDIQRIVRRRPVLCETSTDRELLHLDVRIDDSRVLALTMRTEDEPAADRAATRASRLLYAQSPLLAEVGLGPAACDPPTARRLEPEQDAASA